MVTDTEQNGNVQPEGEKEKKFAPLLPYDSTIGDKFEMYDNSEYYNKRDVTSLYQNTKETGNVVKFYTLNYTADEPVVIENEKK